MQLSLHNSTVSLAPLYMYMKGVKIVCYAVHHRILNHWKGIDDEKIVVFSNLFFLVILYSI